MTGDHITESQLPINITGKDLSLDTAMLQGDGQNFPTDQPLEEIEKRAIIATLESTGGNKSETARRLGINRKTLHNKLKSYGLD